MILEGIVTTLDAECLLNVAPMGPRVEPDFDRFVLRPFRTSTTYRNLKAHGEGVLHITDDVLLLARAAIGKIDDISSAPATEVRGRVLLESCRYFEFRVHEVDEREERASFDVVTVHRGVFREFFGFNRAKHAVLEAAILATRVHFLAPDSMERDLEKFRVIVEKTGGNDERMAFEILVNHIHAVRQERERTEC
ncbi:MAG: DUF447 family protein [Isosphaeraceae bacterium]